MSYSKNKLIKVWRYWSKHFEVSGSVFPEQNADLLKEDMVSMMGKVFCPGPFYFYFFNFVHYRLDYVHPTIQEVLGYEPGALSFQELFEKIHPDDQTFMQASEKLIGDFMFRCLKPEEIKHYKFTYCIRIKTKQGPYKTILHQALTYSQLENGHPNLVFGAHTDITHLVNKPRQTVSFIDLRGKKSFFNLNPFVDSFEKALEKNPPSTFRPLTIRESEVLGMISEGMTDSEISEALSRSKRTIGVHRRNALKKLDSKNATQAVAKAIRLGII